MNKTLVILALLCGTATAGELTPAQKIAIRRYYDDSIENAKRFILKVERDLESNTDPARHERLMRMKSVKERELSGMEREREDAQHYEAFWRSLQIFKGTKNLQWQEPTGDEKEGKWVPIPERLKLNKKAA